VGGTGVGEVEGERVRLAKGRVEKRKKMKEKKTKQWTKGKR
jgi:hypothetical protein